MCDMNDSHVSISDVFVNANADLSMKELESGKHAARLTFNVEQFPSLRRQFFSLRHCRARQKGPFLIKIVLTLLGSTDARDACMY